MKVSFHKQRHVQSLPPRPARSGKLLVVAAAVLCASAVIAGRALGEDEPVLDPSPQSLAAEQGVRDTVDTRLVLHLRRLQ